MEAGLGDALELLTSTQIPKRENQIFVNFAIHLVQGSLYRASM